MPTLEDMTLSAQEARCVRLACDFLSRRDGTTWGITPGPTLDSLYPNEPSPEVLVSDGRRDAAIEVKELHGSSNLIEHTASTMSLMRTMVPSCGGSYHVMPPSGLHLPIEKALRRRVAREIERVSPSLSVGESGVLLMPRQGYLVFRAHPSNRDVHCIHNDGRSLLEPLVSVVKGDLYLIDDRDPEHSFVTEQARSAFLSTLQTAYEEGRCSSADMLSWNEEWMIGKDGDDDDEVFFLTVTEAFDVASSVEECLDTILSKALAKFDSRRWASEHIIVLEVATSLMSPDRSLPVISEFEQELKGVVDLVLVVDDEEVHQAYPSEAEE